MVKAQPQFVRTGPGMAAPCQMREMVQKAAARLRGQMKPTTESVLSILKSELAFLDSGGYRTSVGERQPLFCMETSVSWRHPMFFEDSPSCPKKRYCSCNPESDCVLLSLVPRERQHETVPCRHIPLNEKGQSIASLSKTASSNEIETILRRWLVKTIESLEESAASEARLSP
jgi:hypothetical protein